MYRCVYHLNPTTHNDTVIMDNSETRTEILDNRSIGASFWAAFFFALMMLALWWLSRGVEGYYML